MAKTEGDQEAALDRLLATLGLGREALTFLREVTPEGENYYRPCD